MSNYPMGAFEALNQMHDASDKKEASFNAALAIRTEELKQGGVIEFTDRPRTVKTLATTLLQENLPEAHIISALQSWVAGEKKQAFGLFDLACRMALEQSAEFLATKDSEVGEW